MNSSAASRTVRRIHTNQMRSQKSLKLKKIKILKMTTINQMLAHKMGTKKITLMGVTATATKHQKMMSNQQSPRPLNAHTN